ncbi:MAG: PAS domain S-box protein [Candidatus Bathyarchaeia archaeon]|jgi:PAS domain S-box-containing protein
MLVNDKTDSQAVWETSHPQINLELTDNKDYLHILHVDDDISFLKISRQILEAEGNFEIDNATSVDEAFQKLGTKSYDAVISDYEMPLKDGLDLLRELRGQQNDIPFILFTGKGREDVAVKALNLSADRYINKNGSPEAVYCELADAINKTVESKKSRKLLAESESKYRMLVEESLQGILITKTSPLQLVFANESMGKILGYSTEELKSLSPEGVAGLIYNEDRNVFFKRLESRMRGEPANSSLEFRAVRKNGSTVWLEAFANRIEYMGQPAVRGMFLDIDERKKVSDILRESEAKYRELANSLPHIVYESDTTGKLVFVNERALEIAGYSNEDFEKGLNILQFLIPEDRQRAMKSMQRLLAGGSYVPTEYVFLRKDGSTFPALITTTLRVSKNKVTGLRGSVIDITESKKAEQLLRKSQEQLKAIILNAPIGIAWSDSNNFFLSANESFCRILGFSEEELQKLTFKDITHPGDINDSNSKMEELVSGRATFFSQEKRYIRKDGTIINGKVTVSAVRDKEDKPALFIAELEDITERKKLELELKKDYDVLERVGESIGAGLAIIGKDYQIIWANTLLRNAVDKSNKKCFQTLNKLDAICPSCGVKKIFDKNVSFDAHEYETMNSKGEKVWIERRVTPLKDKNGVTMAALELAIPVTDRKKAQEAIKFQADLLNHVGQAIIMADNNRTIRFWNKAAEKLYGWSEGQALGQKVNELLGVTSPDEADEVTKRLVAGESWSTEVLAKNRDGSVVPVILNRTPIKNEDEKFVGAAIIATDITLQKNTEADLTFSLISLSNSLDEIQELNEKLRVVGGLTRHDVRNKLSTVNGYAYLLKKKHGDQADIVNDLGKIEEAVCEIVRIFDFAKMYEQIGAEELTYINVEEKLNEAAALFSETIPTIINECHGLMVLADSFLRQLFFNFIDNTRKYGKKTTAIRTYYEKAETGELRLIYEDDGVGIPAEDKLKLFTEGFSTGGSTGFGLFLIRKMVDVYGWIIQETGEPGKSAKFIMTIPRLGKNGKENFQMQQNMTPKAR